MNNKNTVQYSSEKKPRKTESPTTKITKKDILLTLKETWEILKISRSLCYQRYKQKTTGAPKPPWLLYSYGRSDRI